MQKRVVEPKADETRKESKVARAEPSREAPDAAINDAKAFALIIDAETRTTVLLAENEKLRAGHVVLLEALKACVREMEHAASLLEFFPDDYGEAMSLARAAIQQAEGL